MDTAKVEGTETATADAASEEKTTGGRKAVEEQLREALSPKEAMGGAKPETADADESDAEPKTADADESDAEPEAEGGIKDGEIKGLPAEIQAKVNERIHKINIRRKDAETQKAELDAKLKSLESKFQDDFVSRAVNLGLHPEYATKDELAAIERYQKTKQYLAWTKENVGGYEGSGGKDDPTWTAEQVAARREELLEELAENSGAAKTTWTRIRKQMLDDLEAGRKARLSQAAKPAEKKLPTPPKLPGSEGASRKPPASAGSRGKAEFNADEFKKQGGGRTALEKQFDKLFGGH